VQTRHARVGGAKGLCVQPAALEVNIPDEAARGGDRRRVGTEARQVLPQRCAGPGTGQRHWLALVS